MEQARDRDKSRTFRSRSAKFNTNNICKNSAVWRHLDQLSQTVETF